MCQGLREQAELPFELVEYTVVVLCGSIQCRQERPAQAKGRVPPRRAGSETTLNQVDVPRIVLIAQRSTDPTYTARWRVGVRKARDDKLRGSSRLKSRRFSASSDGSRGGGVRIRPSHVQQRCQLCERSGAVYGREHR